MERLSLFGVCICYRSRPRTTNSLAVPHRALSPKVHETPAEFAAQIKKNILAQLTKWEVDRAALQALVDNAGEKAADTAKVCGGTVCSAALVVGASPRTHDANK